MIFSIAKLQYIVYAEPRSIFAGSSNGRTAPSEGVYLGSNPGPAADERRRGGTERSSANVRSLEKESCLLN